VPVCSDALAFVFYVAFVVLLRWHEVLHDRARGVGGAGGPGAGFSWVGWSVAR